MPGIAPQKLPRVTELILRGCRLTVLLDSVEQATAVAEASRNHGVAIGAMIEIDCDGHRGGILPDDPPLIDIAQTLYQSQAQLRGVMTHAGESYTVVGQEAHAVFTERERKAATDGFMTL